MKKNNDENKRRHPRISVRIPALLYAKTNSKKPIRVEIANLSEGGAFVHCAIPISPGEQVTIEILFAHATFIEGEVLKDEETIKKIQSTSAVKEVSVVKWVRGSSTSGFGIEFHDLTPEKREFLKKIMEYFRRLVLPEVDL